MIKRRLFLAQALLATMGCAIAQPDSNLQKLNKFVLGVVAYGEGSQSLERYQKFVSYLETRLKTIIELEPVFNEVKAIDQIRRQRWALVFASPGLAAIAIAEANYLPLFSLQGVNNQSSIIVVQADSPVQTLAELNGKSVALGQPGSATGYYVPLYDLYGTLLSEVRIAPTPNTLLDWVAKREVVAGALSKTEFDQYRSQFVETKFRILHTSRRIPAGAFLVSPAVERNQQYAIETAMREALPTIAQEAGYIANAPPPDYKKLITFIEKVKPIEARIQAKPALLYKPNEKKDAS